MTTPTTLYRLYTDTFELLYVGIASNPGRRFEQHAGSKPWWGEVDIIRTQHYDARSDAEQAEREAIRTERPRYNIVHAVPDTPPQIVLNADHIRAVCSACGDLIDPPGGGYLEVHMGAAQRLATARSDPSSGFTDTTEDGVEIWRNVPWHAWHSRCRYDTDEGPVHQVELRNLTSWFDLMRITSDLMGLRVFSCTNWNTVIRALGAGEPGLLRAVSAAQVAS